MRTLFLLRHAASSRVDPGSRDFDRPLTKWGVLAARRVGTHLAEQKAAPDLILCSAARRGRQTLALLLPALPHEHRICIEKDLYMASAPRLLRRLRETHRSVRSILVIAHNPGLQRLARALAGGGDPARIAALKADFPTAGLAVLSLPDKPWSRLQADDATLSALVT